MGKENTVRHTLRNIIRLDNYQIVEYLFPPHDCFYTKDGSLNKESMVLCTRIPQLKYFFPDAAVKP